VALIHGEADIGDSGAAIFDGVEDFVEDSEHGVGIDTSQRQVVVGVFSVVKMEAAEKVFIDQPRDDLTPG
jgi:hypothetical protein